MTSRNGNADRTHAVTPRVQNQLVLQWRKAEQLGYRSNSISLKLVPAEG